MLDRGLILFTFLCTIHTLIQVDSLNNIVIKNIHQSSLVEIIQSGLEIKLSNDYQRVYLSINVSNPRRKKAYQLFKSKYSKTISTLKELGIVKSQQKVLKSKLKQRFTPRSRAYEFSQCFGIEGKKWLILMALNKMKQYGVKETTDSYIINYLNEKWIAIRTIVKAKKRMESLLINLDQIIKVQFIDDIQFFGLNDQDQIEQELISADMKYFQQQLLEDQSQFCYVNTDIGEPVKLKITFQLSKKIQYGEGRHINKSKNNQQLNTTYLEMSANDCVLQEV